MRERQRKDRDEGTKCPYCDALLEVPAAIATGGGSFLGGKCLCGAVYACVPTGHNIGEALLDALNFAFGGSYTFLDSEDVGYKEAVFNYDLSSHRMWQVKDVRKDTSGKLVFISVADK